ncbi:hypothetical protein GCM10010300_08420 [Streptomyces olivaceoviridis]|nr:hypothetical protein GCM10010300_08420 [Streptomyces olivaceoviridis]
MGTPGDSLTERLLDSLVCDLPHIARRWIETFEFRCGIAYLCSTKLFRTDGDGDTVVLPALTHN